MRRVVEEDADLDIPGLPLPRSVDRLTSMPPRSEPPDFKLQTLYLNARRLAELAGGQSVQQVVSAGSQFDSLDKLGLNARIGSLGRVMRDWLWENRASVLRFERLLLTGKLRKGSIFFTERDFYCRNVAPRVRASSATPQMTAKYALAGREVELRLLAHSDHVAPGSAGALLTGRASGLFVVGVVNKIGRQTVDASAVFAGHCVDPSSTDMWPQSPWRTEIQVESINAFAQCGLEAFPHERELKRLKDIPERDIKGAFATLLNEDAVPKDWGGERSDLFTTRVQVRGQRVSASFAFKGPAKFHPMTMADLGKNGDQIDRLLTEPAELLVLQHCHRVLAPVRNMMKAYANQIGNQRSYCVIDGGDTLRILRAYGLCGQTSKPRPPPARDPDDDEPEFDEVDAG